MRTARLTLRIMQPDDAEQFAAYRNHPTAARYQSWGLPYPVADARATLAPQSGRSDLTRGSWTQIAVERDGLLIGDVCARLDDTGGVAEIGFTFAPAHHGQGLAGEAARALVTDLVERLGVVRVYGELDPRNIPSQRLLERLGLVCEGIAQRSFHLRGEWTDTMTYATTAEAWRAWQARATTAPDDVALVEITADTVRSYAALQTHHSQRRFVATVAQSFADALFPGEFDGAPVVPWLRGVTADGEPAGFVMLADATAAHPPYLWRLLVDRRFQGRGIGRRTLDLVCARLRSEAATEVRIGWVEGVGSPAPFYRSYGFVETGRLVDGETEARLVL